MCIDPLSRLMRRKDLRAEDHINFTVMDYPKSQSVRTRLEDDHKSHINVKCWR